ncbi:sodium:calcium antiporter [Sulfolobus tengchongensis]|uniref:Sodium:calcium antiporter n=1 Tax=Sulfolobus tengchongensis TaxID=207809 RepID=A0AAX4KXU7_9CREN
MIWLLILQLIALIILISVSASLMARGTEELEKTFGKGIAGGLILGFINSLPETIIVLFAVLNGSYDIALGSALGGNILLFTLGIGFVSILYYAKYKSGTISLDKDINIEYNSFLMALVIFIVAIIYGRLNYYIAIFLLSPYVYYVYRRYKNYRSEIKIGGNTIRGLTYVLAGGLPLIFISKYFITTIIDVATIFKMSPILLAVLITPIAAELEENLTAIKLILDSPSSATTALMNFIGSKLENMTLLLSIIGLSQTISLRPSLLYLLLIVAVSVLTLGIIRDRNIKINEGLSLFGIYALSVAILLRFSA